MNKVMFSTHRRPEPSSESHDSAKKSPISRPFDGGHTPKSTKSSQA